MELRREQYNWVEVRCLFYEGEYRDVHWVVCQTWGPVVRWYVCVGVPPSSASCLCEDLC